MSNKRSSSRYKTIQDIFTPSELDFYSENPAAFIEDVIFRDKAKINGGKFALTPDQELMAQSLLDNDLTSVAAGRGIGKAQSYNTKTPTPLGMVSFGSLKRGDEVFGQDGNPTEVVEIFEQGEREIYRVTFDDGSTTETCKEHLWNVKGRQSRRKNLGWETLELQDIMAVGVKRKFESGREDRQWEVPTLSGAVKYKRKSVTIDPYVLGAWLGDGSKNKSEITNIDNEVVSTIRARREIHKNKTRYSWTISGLKQELRELCLVKLGSHERFVPDRYKYNTAKVRLELLRGILDTDGTVNINGTVRYGSTSKALLDDVVEIARSLGYKVHSKGEYKVGSYKKGGVRIVCKKYYRCTITTPPNVKLFYIKRKQDRIATKQFRYYGKKWIESIELIGVEKTRCIMVSADDSLYLTSDFIVTHNSAFLAWIIIWWLTIYSEPKIVAIAPSFPQLQSVLWPEINKWLKRSAVRDCFVWGRKRIYLRTDPSNSFAEPRTATKEEAMQGLHEDNLLVLVDEASGVNDAIWDVIQGSLTNQNNKVFLMSNPTQVTGFFYDSHHSEKSLWSTFTFSSENSPVVDPKYIERMRFKYVHGNQIHDLYKMHVQGIFPSGDPDAFFTMHDVNKMMSNTTTTPKGAVEIGVDVARKGDDETVIAARQGYYFFSAQELGLFKGGEPTLYTNGRTTIPEVVQMVVDTIDAIRDKTHYEGIIRVKVDDTGVGGGCTDLLELQAATLNIEVVPCHFGGSGKDYEFDANEATHLWANLSNYINTVRLPFDKALMEELVARRWFPNEAGKRKIESKKDFKKKFKGSPDRADAVVLCMAETNRLKLMAESFGHSQTNLVTASGHEIMSRGQTFIGVYCSPLGHSAMVGVSKLGTKIGVFMHLEGTSYELTDMLLTAVARGTRILGSPSLFSGGMPIGIELMSMGIPIVNAYKYNEANAIRTLDGIMDMGELTIGAECSTLIAQLSTWARTKSRSELAESHAGCYALLVVLSEVRLSADNSLLTGFSF